MSARRRAHFLWSYSLWVLINTTTNNQRLMYDNAKNTANYLAKSETLLNIALPTGRDFLTAIYIKVVQIWTYSRSTSTSSSRDQLALKGGTSFLFTYIINLLIYLCQLVSKASIQGIIVPVPHLFYPQLNILGGVFCRRTSIEPNSPTCP